MLFYSKGVSNSAVIEKKKLQVRKYCLLVRDTCWVRMGKALESLLEARCVSSQRSLRCVSCQRSLQVLGRDWGEKVLDLRKTHRACEVRPGSNPVAHNTHRHVEMQVYKKV